MKICEKIMDFSFLYEAFFSNKQFVINVKLSCLLSMGFKIDALWVDVTLFVVIAVFYVFLFCLLGVSFYICNKRLNFVIKTSRF